MKYYPVVLDLAGRVCLVAGGGAVAERKVRALLDAGAEVTVVSPSLTAGLRDRAAAGTLVHRSKLLEERDLEGAFLVIAATDDDAVNDNIAGHCRKRGVLVNVATSPAASSFLVPSVVERGDLLIAVSTSGASPALARQVRMRLEREFGPEYAALLEALARLRQRLPASVADEATRRGIYEAVVDSDALVLLQNGDHAGAERTIQSIVERMARKE